MGSGEWGVESIFEISWSLRVGTSDLLSGGQITREVKGDQRWVSSPGRDFDALAFKKDSCSLAFVAVDHHP